MKFKNEFEIPNGGGYVTPEVLTLEVQSEGILCQSGETEDYNYSVFEW